MKDWHKSGLIPLRKAVEKYPNMQYQAMLDAICGETIPLYYLIPPRRFASQKPDDLKFVRITDVNLPEHTALLDIWDGSTVKEIEGPYALPVPNPEKYVKDALYALIVGDTNKSLNTPVDKSNLTLTVEGHILIPSRPPQDPFALEPTEIDTYDLVDMFIEQNRESPPIFYFREIDDDPMTMGDFLISESLLPPLISPAIEEKAGEEPESVGPKERRSLLNTIWALKELILESKKSNQTGIITDLVDKYPKLPGIAKSTLAKNFAEANELNSAYSKDTSKQ